MALRRRPGRPHIFVECGPNFTTYPHSISMYKQSPKNFEQYELLEDMSIDRVQVLKIIECASMPDCKILSEDWKSKIYKGLKKQGMDGYLQLIKGDKQARPSDIQFRYQDVVSHHILRLAYCRTKKLRQWFVRQEVDLFRLRLSNLSEDCLARFLADEAEECHLLTADEVETLREEINSSTHGMFTFGVTKMYRVDWLKVQSLVESQAIFVLDGFAYVPSYQMHTYLVNDLQNRLITYLRIASLKYNAVVDERLHHLLIYINTTYTPAILEDQFKSQYKPTCANIDMYAVENFPLCMRVIHDHLRAKHHLKHFARVQYLFFLRATGMLYEDAMQFWREEFTKEVDARQFSKRYEYSVRHAYGIVGRKKICSPHCCEKIIEEVVGASDVHGCPYKYWDVTTLSKTMQNYGLERQHIDNIVEIKRAGGYQAACAMYFQAIHKQPTLEPVEHPNRYFIESCQLKYAQFENDDDIDDILEKDTDSVAVAKFKDVKAFAVHEKGHVNATTDLGEK